MFRIKYLLIIPVFLSILFIGSNLKSEAKEQVKQSKNVNIFKATFIDIQYSKTLRFENEEGTVFEIRDKDYNLNKIQNQFLLASWVKKQECWLDLRDKANPNWGITYGDSIVWSGDIDDLPVDFDDLYGIGYLFWRGKSDEIPIYSQPSNEYFIRNIIPGSHPDSTGIYPKLYKFDYNLFHFVVVDSINGWFQVEQDSRTGKLCWFKESELFKYHTWEEHLYQAVSVRWDEHPIVYDSPSLQANTFNIQFRNDFIHCVSVQGDWMLVSYYGKKYGKPLEQPYSGWIRWRDGVRIKIRLYWLC